MTELKEKAGAEQVLNIENSLIGSHRKFFRHDTRNRNFVGKIWGGGGNVIKLFVLLMHVENHRLQQTTTRKLKRTAPFHHPKHYVEDSVMQTHQVSPRREKLKFR